MFQPRFAYATNAFIRRRGKIDVFDTSDSRGRSGVDVRLNDSFRVASAAAIKVIA
jgi:hypothetical protein